MSLAYCKMYSGGPTGIFANALAAWGALQGPNDTHGRIIARIPQSNRVSSGWT